MVVLLPKLPIFRVAPPFVNINLSEVNTSVVPSVLINEYLSSSKGKNLSLSPAVTELVSPPLILTVNDLLTVRDAFVKSTLDIDVCGSSVYKVLSEDFANSVFKILKSVTFLMVVGKSPHTIPSTSATFEIIIVSVPTAVTLP